MEPHVSSSEMAESAQAAGETGLAALSETEAIAQLAGLAGVAAFAGEVAHELNNPATVLNANLQILKEDISKGVSDRALHEELVDECALAMERINEVSRRIRCMTRGLLADRPEALDLEGLVREGCRAGRFRLPSDTNLGVEFSIAPGLRVHSGRSVAQIFTNVFINAAEAMAGQTSPAPRIVVRSWADGEDAIVEFQDNGPGVPKDLEHRIFEPFFSSRGPSAATGLGLTLCRNLALRSRGRISLHANGEPGACFRVRLPLAPTGEGLGG